MTVVVKDPSAFSRGRRARASRPLPARAALAVVAAVMIAATGCGQGDQSRRLPTGSSSHTLRVGGAARTFHAYRPARLPSPAPLVVMLHGGFGNGKQAQRTYGWDAAADAGGFVVAYPDGIRRAWSVGGGCCGRPGRDAVDDVGFLTAMVGDIQRKVPIDTKRIYATGVSNGGFMAYRLACDTTMFAAIGPDAATLLGDCPAPAPASVIHIHGTADESVRYDGAPGTGPGRIDGPAVPEVAARWRATGKCAEPAVSTSGAVTTSTAGCPEGRTVTFITIDGAGHQWPGSADTPGRRLLDLDPPSTALNATDTIWRFFKAHPKP